MFRGISITTVLLIVLATAACLGLGDCGEDNGGTGPGSFKLTCNSSVTGGQVPFVVQFTADVDDRAGVVFIWDFGDGTRSSGDASAKTYTRSGSFTATVTARRGTEEATCRLPIAATSSVQVEAVTAAPDSGNAPLEVHFVARAVNLAHAVVGTSSAYTYRWDFGDGGSSTEANPVHTYMQPGGYRARVVIQSGSAQAEQTVMVTVYGSLEVTCSASPQTGLPPLAVTFSAQAVGQSQCSYKWEFDDGGTSDRQSPSYTYLWGNIYHPTVTAVCGQVQGACRQTITIRPDPNPTPWPEPAATPTPGGGGTPTPTPGGGETPTPTATPTDKCLKVTGTRYGTAPFYNPGTDTCWPREMATTVYDDANYSTCWNVGFRTDAVFVQTRLGDVDRNLDPYLTFSVNVPVRVTVMVDLSGTDCIGTGYGSENCPEAEWLQEEGFTVTSTATNVQQLDGGDSFSGHEWVKEYPAGSIQLGTPRRQDITRHTYAVAVAPVSTEFPCTP